MVPSLALQLVEVAAVVPSLVADRRIVAAEAVTLGVALVAVTSVAVVPAAVSDF